MDPLRGLGIERLFVGVVDGRGALGSWGLNNWNSGRSNGKEDGTSNGD